MHRFGRAAQHKMKDGGGGFVVAAIIALVCAYYVGVGLNGWFGGKAADSNGPTGMTGSMATAPENYDLYFVQVFNVRSESKAQEQADKLAAAGYSAAVTPRNSQGYKVWIGPYTKRDMAMEDMKRITADKAFEATVKASQPWVHTVKVNGGGAVPAMTGANQELAKAMGVVNSYLYEVANWVETRTTAGDTTRVATLGDELNTMVESMTNSNDPAVASMVQMATKAAINAESVQDAAATPASGQAYQEAMNGYLALLHDYNNMSAPSGN